MCEIWEEIKAKGISEGFEKGMNEGLAKGEQTGKYNFNVSSLTIS